MYDRDERRMTQSSDGRAPQPFMKFAVAIMIVGILTAIAIPAVTGQKAADTPTAKSLLRHGAVAMESYFANALPGAALDPAALSEIEPLVDWELGVEAPSSGETAVAVEAMADGASAYVLRTSDRDGRHLTYFRSDDGQIVKCISDDPLAATALRTDCGGAANRW